ncbi:MAG: ATPase [Pirellula sp.]|nr:ATPase [Pirellula sp.]
MDTAVADRTSTSLVAHVVPLKALFEQFQSGPEGLAPAEAAQRLDKFGPNELQAPSRFSVWQLLAAQFKNVLIVILIAATLVSAAMGHAVEAAVITVIVLFAALLGFIQEFRAGRALEALRKLAAPQAKAIRGGEEIEVLARELVPGDVILLHPGDRTPADCRLIEAVNLQVEESALTGESTAAEKQAADTLADDAPLAERSNMVFAGTVVTYGRGRGVVTATGMETEFGGVARLMKGVDSGKTPLQINLDRVGRTLGKAAIAVVAVIVAAGVVRGQPLLEMLLFGVALAVAVVPEALPAIVTISLAIGVQRMAKRNALVRRLPAVETLGCTTVICTDKTGTLTKDEMTAVRIWAAGEVYEVTGAGYEPIGEFRSSGQSIEPPTAVRELLTAGMLACDARVVLDEHACRWQVHGDPTEGALIVVAAKANLNQTQLQRDFPRVGEIPFSSETKRMTTLHDGPHGAVAYTKGAPEVILADSVHILMPSSLEPLDDDRRQKMATIAQQFADDALRVLAVARKATNDAAAAKTELTFLGFVGMIDPPRPEAQRAIAACRAAGIRTIMITGDHPRTAAAVATQLAILDLACPHQVVTGAQLENASPSELDKLVECTQVYARVSPAHKLRLVDALQRRGAIVAMTGDGVNDAPALKKADIGIAMGITGTDVTKEAAAMTLTDENFASIVAAVEEGRAIYENIKKYLMFLLSSNIGEIGLMAGAAALGMPMPLTAVQILYVNLATDGLPALALAVDPAEPGLMKQRPRAPRSGIFTRPVITLMAVGGLWSAVVNLGLFAWALHVGKGLPAAMTMTFVSLVLIQLFKAYNFRSDRNSVFIRPLANRWLNLAVWWEAALLTMIVMYSPLNAAFDAVPLTIADWGLTLLVSASVSPVLELTKLILRHCYPESVASS